MKSYKCYLLDPFGRICHVEPIECDDDSVARTRAAELLLTHPSLQTIELWDGERRVSPA